MIDHHPPMNAYLAISMRAAHVPDRDIALLWDERSGWSVATERAAGDLVTIAHLGGDVLPTPMVIAEFVQSVLVGAPVTPLRHVPTSTCDLQSRLDRFANRRIE